MLRSPTGVLPHAEGPVTTERLVNVPSKTTPSATNWTVRLESVRQPVPPSTPTDVFVACEPRRSWRALAGSHLIGGLGANSVTRTDAVLSVHAGFRDRELSSLWPDGTGWQLDEAAFGPFSHWFCAVRAGAS